MILTQIYWNYKQYMPLYIYVWSTYEDTELSFHIVDGKLLATTTKTAVPLRTVTSTAQKLH